MKSVKLFLLSVISIILITFFSCNLNNSNKKLNQENAEKTIKEFVKTHSINAFYCQFDLNSITSIDKVNQFSETEAYVISLIGQQQFKFTFKKNIDDKWVLMSIEAPMGANNGTTEHLIQPNQNISMVAQ